MQKRTLWIMLIILILAICAAIFFLPSRTGKNGAPQEQPHITGPTAPPLVSEPTTLPTL